VARPRSPPASGDLGAAQQDDAQGRRTSGPAGGARRLTLYFTALWFWPPAAGCVLVTRAPLSHTARRRGAGQRRRAHALHGDTREHERRARRQRRRRPRERRWGGVACAAGRHGAPAPFESQPALVRTVIGVEHGAQLRAPTRVDPHHHTLAALFVSLSPGLAGRLPRDPPPPLPHAAPSCTRARRRAGHDGQRGGRRACEARLRPGRQPGRGRLPRRVAAAPGRLPGGPSLPLTLLLPGRLPGGQSLPLTLLQQGAFQVGPPEPARSPIAYRRGAGAHFPAWRPGRSHRTAASALLRGAGAQHA